MKHFTLSLRVPSGGLLIAGYSETPEGLHGAHARGRDGRPIVPATALRGALRETYERLLRGAEFPACSGGDGRMPGAEEANPSPGLTLLDRQLIEREATEGDPEIDPQAWLCRLDHGERCRACRLFGTRRPAITPGERGFSALRLSDACGLKTLESSSAGSKSPGSETLGSSWTIRPGVGIARRTRSAENNRLFLRQVPSTPFLQLTADLWLFDETFESELRAIVSATSHVGSGRSRGLGRIELALEEAPPQPVSSIRLEFFSEVRLRLTLESPAAFSSPVTDGQLVGTRSEIPGPALRGMLGFALARSIQDTGQDPDVDAPFQTLVHASNGAQFGFLYPTRGADIGGGELSAPLPITAQTCKAEGREHGVRDGLLEQIAAALVIDADGAVRVADQAVVCAHCHAPLRTAEGVRRAGGRVELRTVTRVELERSRQSARDEALFSRELIDAGTTFEGSIRNVPPGSLSRLEEALQQPLAIGRGHAYGWGRLQVQVLPPLPAPSLEARRSEFQARLSELLKHLRLSSESVGRWVPITLLSPFIPRQGPGASPAWSLNDEVGELLQVLPGTRIFLPIRRFDREGSWDQRAGRMSAFHAVAAGGVYVLELPAEHDPATVLDVLKRLEAQGIGERRHQGYGRILCFDPFHLNHSMIKEEPMRQEELRSHRGKLVQAAEGVVRGLFDGKVDLKKSQLNHLVSVCGDAASIEEIKNYLRYQAGRDGTGWTIQFCQKVIDGPVAILAELAKAQGEGDSRAQELALVEAWRLYAVYLTRAFTYEDKRSREQRREHERSGAQGR